MNDWVLVTGASSGIGLELARVFASHGQNVVLVARDESRLRTLAADLQARHKIETLVLCQDLARPEAAREVFDRAQAFPVATLVNNAGFGDYGLFASGDPRRHHDMMQVNMIALVELTYLFLQPMIARRSGRILNVASVAAFVPGPTVSLYYASKAFVFSFSYALAEEVEAKGITVTALCPGTTRTEFFERARIHMRRPYPMMDAREVAEAGFKGLMRGKRVVIPGLTNKIMAGLVRRVPPRLPAKIVRRIHQG